MAKTDENWTRLETAFAAAVALDGPDRERFVTDFAAKHPGLANQLRALLAADSTGGHTLAVSVRAAVAAVSGVSRDAWEGRDIGPWRIVERIADGGMGAVFRAERTDDEYAQTVAIKVVATHFLAADAAARFRAERQILANLDHPNIARLIDGGSIDDRLPYLVMEYVDGLPLDTYCEAHSLNVVERLRLFNKVCIAVDYAHRNLVVHRDLKPSNILVDGRGEPRLLDFGIAKLLQEDGGSGAVALTRVGSRLMTPEYASPEQVRGEPATVATDVYALGILLYRLLTGTSPYRIERGDRLALEKAILTAEPTRPSTMPVASLGTRRLAGDLDNIALKAIQKDPDRRYPSAAELSLDITRFLEHKPVSARADSWTYVLSKFVRRHRAGVAAAALFAVSIAALSTVYTLQVTEQRDIAIREAAKATQVSNFLGSLFESSDPAEARGKSVTAAELLERGAARIDAKLDDQPAVRAAMLNVIGDVQRKLGDGETAVALLRDSVEVSSRTFGPDAAETADAAHLLGVALMDTGDIAAAQVQLLHALDVRRATLGPADVRTLRAAADLAYAHYRLNEYDTAEPLYREAMALEATAERRDREFATTMTQFGQLLKARGEYDEAEPLMRHALAIRQELFGRDHPEIGDSYFNLAQLLELKGDFGEAERFFRQALELDTRMLGDSHPYIASDRTNLARVLGAMGRFAEAEALYEQAIELRREIVGDDHPDLATDLYYFGVLLLRDGQYARSEAMFLESLDIRREVYDSPHRVIADNLVNLGRIKVAGGDVAAAFDYIREGLEMRRRALGDSHREVADTFLELAAAHEAAGDLDAAEASAREGLTVYEAAFDEPHPNTLRGRMYLANLLQNRSKYRECAREAAAARELAARLPFPDPARLAETTTLFNACSEPAPPCRLCAPAR